MAARVYIETTIPSFYFETRSSPRVQEWRTTTREWWAKQRSHYEVVTSQYVLDELGLAPRAKAASALALLAGVRVLPTPPAIERIIEEYTRRKLMPADAVGDAAHLAITSLHGVDFLLTWNCQHLANANKVPHIRAVNESLGLSIPTLTTPITLRMEAHP